MGTGSLPGGRLVACHWTGSSPDHLLHGHTVHDVLDQRHPGMFQLVGRYPRAHRRRRPARCLRHLTERAATEAIERFGRAFASLPLVGDDQIVRLAVELALYVRQCHAQRDLEALGIDLAARR